jgi:putative oxygen-independent coproporphyrinogen III oxidase
VLSAPPPLSLYVHLPWCVRKCPYCDFNSFEAATGFPEQDYIAALMADLEQSLPLIWGRRIQTVFFGGGTPSLFSPSGIDAILEGVRARLPLAPFAEITLEANPGTVEAEKFRGFREAGINRLSLGIQSFNPRHLAALGRIHDDREARRAVEAARKCFDNLNLDLIYALPRQTPEEALADVATALGFAPDHLSAYHLTLEPGTAFHRQPPPVPDDDTAYAMQEAIAESLEDAGYRHYETSAYARPGKECRHNLNYWRFGDYLGIGAGAHGKLTLPPREGGLGGRADESATVTPRILRQARHRSPAIYMEKAGTGNAVEQERRVETVDLPFEFLMNGLRLADGFTVATFEERTGLAISAIAAELEQAVAAGLLETTAVGYRPTRRGRDFLNDLLELFLP